MPQNPFYRQYLLPIILLLFCNLTFGQTEAAISGNVVNPQNEPLEYVSVALLHPKDSTMINFTTTDIKGDFKIIENSRDSLLLQFFSTGYVAYFKKYCFRT